MPDTDILVSELNSASQINTTDLLLMTQPDGDAQTGYSSRKGTVLQVANKLLKDTEYTTDLPNFDNKSVFGALNEIHNGTYIYKENETPYQLRQTPITANRTLEKLIGVSCAFNQLASITTSTETLDSGNITITRDGSTNTVRYQSNGLNAMTDSGTVLGGDYWINIVKPNHIIYITLGNNTDVPNFRQKMFASPNSSWTGSEPIFAIEQTSKSVIARVPNGCNYVTWYFNIRANTTVDITFKPMVIDLTACFGSEVADYLYNLENG